MNPVAQNFYPCDREQQLLMPPSLDEWLPGDDLARFIVDCVNGLDLRGFYTRYRADGKGHAAYEPSMLVALLLYSYAIGMRSARQIETGCVNYVPMRYIAANAQPDHCTIARFRQRFSSQVEVLFSQVLTLCHKARMLRLGVIAIDGTKIHADASMDANATAQHFQEIASRILQEAEAVDAQEDEKYGKDKRGDEAPGWMSDPEQRRRKIRELMKAQKAEEKSQERERQAQEKYEDARAVYEQKKAEGKPAGHHPKKPRPNPCAKINATDPDSQVHQDKNGGFIQAYNCQAAVDADTQIILSTDVTGSPSDRGLLPVMIEKTLRALETTGRDPWAISAIVADAGYWAHRPVEKAIQVLENLPADLLVAVPPRYQKLTGEISDNAPPPPGSDIFVQLEHKQRRPAGQEIFRKRGRSIESVFGQIKNNRKTNRFHQRGIENVKAEWSLVCLTHNLLKLWRRTTRQFPGKAPSTGPLAGLIPVLIILFTTPATRFHFKPLPSP